MPVDLQVIRASEFIRMRAEGKFDFEASRDLLLKVADACHKRGATRALIDLREVEYGPSPVLSQSDLAQLVDTFCETCFSAPRYRLALLYSQDPHKRARMFASMTAERGGQVRATTDFEESMLWLAEDEETATDDSSNKHHVPIQFLDENPTQTNPESG